VLLVGDHGDSIDLFKRGSGFSVRANEGPDLKLASRRERSDQFERVNLCAPMCDPVSVHRSSRWAFVGRAGSGQDALCGSRRGVVRRPELGKRRTARYGPRCRAAPLLGGTSTSPLSRLARRARSRGNKLRNDTWACRQRLIHAASRSNAARDTYMHEPPTRPTRGHVPRSLSSSVGAACMSPHRGLPVEYRAGRS